MQERTMRRAAFQSIVASTLLAALLWVGNTPGSETLAAGLPTTQPEAVGLSKERLSRIGDALNADIKSGRLPGAVVLIARRGKVAYWEAFGERDPATHVKMAKDDLFRIYSMTKPLTTVSIMMLVEEGKIQISDPVSKYIPSFKQMQVAIPDKGSVTLVPANREMTIQDLLRHTSGLTYGFRETHVKKQYEEAGATFANLTNAEMVERLSKLPLAFHPGTVWEYSYATDVLGRVVEIVSGKTLGDFFEARILKPLKMPDTFFFVPEAKWPRVAQPGIDLSTGKLEPMFDPKVARKFESGGGGATSTAGDYVRLAQMLLNGGELEGVRLLGPKTVAWMTSDALGTISRAGTGYLPGPGYTFGLGFAVRETTGLSAVPGTPGEFNWGGAGGTYFWVDPKEQLVGILMLQSPSQRVYARLLIKTLVLQSIVD